MNSNKVLEALRPGLETLGYEVERPGPPKKKIQRPVLFGLDGKAERSFEVDAWHEETATIVEIEAGRAVVNYQFLKDLFEACAIQTAEWLALAVMNRYKPPSSKTGNEDFARVCSFMETLYSSERLQLPLQGVFVIGY